MFLADSKTFSLDMISGLEAYAINKATESKRYKVEKIPLIQSMRLTNMIYHSSKKSTKKSNSSWLRKAIRWRIQK